WCSDLDSPRALTAVLRVDPVSLLIHDWMVRWPSSAQLPSPSTAASAPAWMEDSARIACSITLTAALASPAGSLAQSTVTRDFNTPAAWLNTLSPPASEAGGVLGTVATIRLLRRPWTRNSSDQLPPS